MVVAQDNLVGMASLGARADFQHLPYTLQRSVFVAFRILRQQLVCPHTAVGIDRDDVGERAAAIDPELPLACRVVRISQIFIPNCILIGNASL